MEPQRAIEAAEALYPAYVSFLAKNPGMNIWDFLATTSYTQREIDDIRIRLAEKAAHPEQRLPLTYTVESQQVAVGTFRILQVDHRSDGEILVCTVSAYQKGGYDMEDEYHESGYYTQWTPPNQDERQSAAFLEEQANLKAKIAAERAAVERAQRSPYDG